MRRAAEARRDARRAALPRFLAVCWRHDRLDPRQLQSRVAGGRGHRERESVKRRVGCAPLRFGALLNGAFVIERRAGRNPLLYCHGGPGTLVARAAIELNRGSGGACRAVYTRLAASGCDALKGKLREWVPRDGLRAPGLGHGEAGLWLDRIACLGAAVRPRAAPMPVRTGRFPPFVDELFGFCL